MKAHLKKIIIILAAVFIMAYIAFPIWSKTLIKSQLPQGWHADVIDIGYPTFFSLSINQLSLSAIAAKSTPADNNTISSSAVIKQLNLTNLSVSYNFSQLEIEQLEIVLNNNASSTNPPKNMFLLDDLKLPKIDFKQLKQRLPNIEINANNVIVTLDNQDKTKSKTQGQGQGQGQNTNSNFTPQELQFKKVKIKHQSLNNRNSLTNIDFNLNEPYAFDSQQDFNWQITIADQSVETELKLKLEPNKTIDKQSVYKNLINVAYSNSNQDKSLLTVKLNYFSELYDKLKIPSLKNLLNQYSSENFSLDKNYVTELKVEQHIKPLNQQRLLKINFDLRQPNDKSLFSFSNHLLFESNRLNINNNQATLNIKQFKQIDLTIAEAKIALQAEDILLDQQTFDQIVNRHLFNKHSVEAVSVEAPHVETVSNKENNVGAISVKADLKLNDIVYKFDSNLPPLKTSLTATLRTQSSNLKQLINSIHLTGKAKLYELAPYHFENHQLFNNAQSTVKLVVKGVTPNLQQGYINLVLNDSDGQIAGFNFNQFNLNSLITLSDTSIVSSNQISLNQQDLTEDAPVKVNYNRQNHQIKASFNNAPLPKDFVNTLIDSFAADLSQTLGEIKITSGKIIQNATITKTSNQPLKTQHLSQFENINISIGDIKINNASINNILSQLAPINLQSKFNAKNIQLASGLELLSPSVNINITNKNLIELNQLSVKLLSAQLQSESMRIVDGQLQPSKLNITQLPLFEVISFMDVKAIFAEGLLDITLPIESAGDNIIVKNAEFKNTSEGIIKYSTGGSSQNKNIALQALENFHFKQLDGTLDYNAQGFYKIKLHLLGANPELYNGYPIDFTINLSGNLPDLFKSLFITGDFEQAIMDKVRTQPVETKPIESDQVDTIN